jgi:hypothetical protein
MIEPSRLSGVASAMAVLPLLADEAVDNAIRVLGSTTSP